MGNVSVTGNIFKIKFYFYSLTIQHRYSHGNEKNNMKNKLSFQSRTIQSILLLFSQKITTTTKTTINCWLTNGCLPTSGKTTEEPSLGHRWFFGGFAIDPLFA